MSLFSETFPSATAGAFLPFVDGLDAVGRRILVLLPHNGHPVGALVVTRVLRVVQSPGVLTFYVQEHRSETNGMVLHLTAVQYDMTKMKTQTSDGLECFCVIDDRHDTVKDLVIIYSKRYRHALIALVEE